MPAHRTGSKNRKQGPAKLGLVVSLFAALAPAPLRAEPLPDCALKGAMSVMIGGRPALRLSDVARCPASLYEVIPSIQIEGQPLVHFKTGATEKANCTATGDATVSVEGKQATRLGDVNCQQN
ncbi:MAG: hypothetical protein RLZZ444_4142 [Pseudomonadota bacterium]|jgi:uncharacterized Zn-binding protein involved in type VI secretion